MYQLGAMGQVGKGSFEVLLKQDEQGNSACSEGELQ